MAEIPSKLLDYELDCLLGKGGYGKVYKGKNLKNSHQFAIKFSAIKEKLYKEYQFLSDLQLSNDFPKIYDYQEFPDQDALIMELLGRNLSFYTKETPLTLNCICAIGIKLLSSIEKMHETGILHRDLKPGNFVTTLDLKHLKIVDFGIASYFMVGGHHKEFKTRRKCKGTSTFASINNHLGFRQSRRDDVECLAYTLMFLLTGTLPWKSINRVKGFNKWRSLLCQKISVSESNWFRNLPPEFPVLLQYSRKLTYEQSPNYCYLKTLLCKYVHLNHLYSYFDWYDIKNDTNLGTSQQIVDGATMVTKLKRERKDTRIFYKDRKVLFNRKKYSKSFDLSHMIKCKSQDVSNENYEKIEERRGKKVKKSRKIRKVLKSNQFLQLPTYDNIQLINHRKIDKDSELSRVRSQMTIECGHFQTSMSEIMSENNQIIENLKNSLSEVKQDESPQTPKSDFPEFKDKLMALKTKHQFFQADRKQKTDCYIF